MLGYLSARQVLRMGRDAFFPNSCPDLPSRTTEQLRCDDLIPQFGYVGQRYAERRIILMFINPANGSDPRSAGDERMMPDLARFVKLPTEDHFVRAGNAYRAECYGWPMSRRYHSFLFGEDKLSPDEVAFVNCLPWRTASGTAFSHDVAKATSRLYTGLLLDELKPKILVTMGKRADEIVRLSAIQDTRDNSWKSFSWNLAQAQTDQVCREREATAAAILSNT